MNITLELVTWSCPALECDTDQTGAQGAPETRPTKLKNVSVGDLSKKNDPPRRHRDAKSERLYSRGWWRAGWRCRRGRPPLRFARPRRRSSGGSFARTCKDLIFGILILNSLESSQKLLMWWGPDALQWWSSDTQWPDTCYPMIPNDTQWYPIIPNDIQQYPMLPNVTQWSPMITKWSPMIPNALQRYL